MKFLCSLKKLLRCRKDLSALEFALFLPVLLIALVGSVEVSRYIIILQKVDKTAYTIADMVSQSEPNEPGKEAETWRISRTQAQDVTRLYQDLMDPYWADEVGIMSSMSFTQNDPADLPVIDWVVIGGGGYNGPAISEVSGRSIFTPRASLEGQPVSLTPQLQQSVDSTGGFLENENVIVIEVFMTLSQYLSPV